MKKEGTAPADHTAAPEQLDCPYVDTYCKCVTTATCKTAQCEFRKADRGVVPMYREVCQRCAPDLTGRAIDEERTTQGPDGYMEGTRAARTHEGGGRHGRAQKGKKKGKIPGRDHSTPPRTETSRAERRGGATGQERPTAGSIGRGGGEGRSSRIQPDPGGPPTPGGLRGLISLQPLHPPS